MHGDRLSTRRPTSAVRPLSTLVIVMALGAGGGRAAAQKPDPAAGPVAPPPDAVSSAPSVTISPLRPASGDPVLVTVTGVKAKPKGKADGKALVFYDVRGGYQALFAVPLERTPGTMTVSLRGGLPSQTFDVGARKLPESQIQVPAEFVMLTPETKKRVDDDNRAIRKSFTKAVGPARFTRPFGWPVTGDPSSPFGELRTFNGVAKSHHLGLDLAARQGAPIRSINDGVVVLVRDCFMAGNVVVVSHGAGIASAYFHLSETSVAEGDVIERGATVGRTGSTGRATGPHVHVSVWALNDFVDPATFLRLGFIPRDVPETAVPGKDKGQGEGKEPKKSSKKDGAKATPAAKKPAKAKSAKSAK